MTADGNPARVQVIHSDNRPNEPLPLTEWLAQLVWSAEAILLLVPNAQPAIRVEGTLAAVGESLLSGEEIEAAVLPAMAAHAREEYRQYGIADSSYRVEGLGRFRINLHRERGERRRRFGRFLDRCA